MARGRCVRTNSASPSAVSQRSRRCTPTTSPSDVLTSRRGLGLHVSVPLAAATTRVCRTHRASDPRRRRRPGRRRFKCAVVLCDMKWLDPDMEEANGISATEQSDMLRLDALVLMVQLNVRKLIAVRGSPCASADFTARTDWSSPPPPSTPVPTYPPASSFPLGYQGVTTSTSTRL